MSDDAKAPSDDIAGVVHLLRALATGTDHIANKHDVIFTAAADALDRLRTPLPADIAKLTARLRAPTFHRLAEGDILVTDYALADMKAAADALERLAREKAVILEQAKIDQKARREYGTELLSLRAEVKSLQAERDAIRAKTIAECEAAIDGFTRDEFGSVYADDLLEAFAELRGTSSKPEAPPISELKVELLGGNCPVQAEGTVAGTPFYFRARGQHWSFGVGEDPIGAPTWERSETWGDEPFAAGWMPEDEARRIIERCAAEFLKEKTDG